MPNAGGNIGGLLENLPLSPPTDKIDNAMPPINISITINGNANADTMREAGQVWAVDLKKELDNWWRERDHDKGRRSFI